MGFYRYTSGSGSGTIPASSVYKVDRLWVSCVGGGGGALSFVAAADSGQSGAGGGWGYAAVSINQQLNQSYNFSYSVGSGGNGVSAGAFAVVTAGSGGTSSCLSVIGFGGQGGDWFGLPRTGGGYQVPAGSFNSGGSNGGNSRQAFYYTLTYAGKAGGAGNSPCDGAALNVVGFKNGSFNLNDTYTSCTFIGSETAFDGSNGPECVAAGGGNGNDGTGTSVTGNQGSVTNLGSRPVTSTGGNGVYGGGGGCSYAGYTGSGFGDLPAPEITYATHRSGNGGSGVVYVSWVELSASKTTLSVGETIAVSWSSPFGSGTDNVSFSNSGTQTYTKTDSKGAQSSIVFTVLPPVNIETFTYNPSPQNSSTGVPQYSVQLFWTVSGGAPSKTYTVTNLSTGQVYNNASSGMTLSGLPQSVAGSLSPATRQVKLVSTDGFTSDEATITIQVRNDNSPTTAWTTTFSNLNPNTSYQVTLGQLQGVDMPTIGSTSGSGNFLGDGVGGSFSNPKTFTNGNPVVLQFTSLPFNTSLAGVSSSSIYGNTNTKTIPVTIGTQTFNVTAITRAPLIAETFNLANQTNLPPFPEIDYIPGLPNEFATSEVMIVDDVEIPVELKSSDPNIQVNINGTGWKDVRAI